MVVFVATIVIALTASSLQQRFPRLIEVGSVVGTLVSVLFLFAIATINVVVLAEVYRLCGRVRRGYSHPGGELDVFLAQRGFLARFLRGFFRLGLPQLAYVPARAFVRARLTRDLGRGSNGQISDRVDLGVPRSVHRGDVAGRQQRQRADGRCVRLGVPEPDAQALQSGDNRHLGGRRIGRGWDRGIGPGRGKAGSRRQPSRRQPAPRQLISARSATSRSGYSLPSGLFPS